MDFTFNIVQSGQQITLGSDGALCLGDVAGYLNEEKYTQSLNIGIYSMNKQYYTENKDEQLLTMGTGDGDIYFIFEGGQKRLYSERFSFFRTVKIVSLNIISKINLRMKVRDQSVLDQLMQSLELNHDHINFESHDSRKYQFFISNLRNKIQDLGLIGSTLQAVLKYQKCDRYTSNQNYPQIELNIKAELVQQELKPNEKQQDEDISNTQLQNNREEVQTDLIFDYKTQKLLNPNLMIQDFIEMLRKIYSIQNISLFLERNGVQIELHSKKYQNFTICEVIKYDLSYLEAQEINKRKIQLNIYFGDKLATLNFKCDLEQTTFQDLKHFLELHLEVRDDIASIDIYVNNILIVFQYQLLKEYFDQNHTVEYKIEMILRFNNNGYDNSVVTLSLTELIRKFKKFENYLRKVRLNCNIEFEIQENQENQETKKFITFIIQRTGKIYNHQICGCIQMKEIAEQFYQIKQILSKDIGIYSFQDQSQSDDLYKKIITRNGSIFVILEGDEKQQCQKEFIKQNCSMQSSLNQSFLSHHYFMPSTEELTLTILFKPTKRKYYFKYQKIPQVRELEKQLQDFFQLSQFEILSLVYMGLCLHHDGTFEQYGISDGSTIKAVINYIGGGGGEMKLRRRSNVGREITQVMNVQEIVQQEIEREDLINLFSSQIQQQNQPVNPCQFINLKLMFESGYQHKIGVNPNMIIDQLVNQIKQDYKIQNLRLIKKQVSEDIDLTSKQYQMLTLFKAGIQDSETLDVMKIEGLSKLKIHILTGPKPINIILNSQCGPLIQG